jgi:hypothetical protein
MADSDSKNIEIGPVAVTYENQGAENTPLVVENPPKVTKKHAGGRPGTITDEVTSNLEKSLQNGFTVLKACDLAKISDKAYYRKHLHNTKFRARMDMAQRWAEEKARQNVVKAINDGDQQTSRWYLERKARDEFATRTEATGKDGVPLLPTVAVVEFIGGAAHEHTTEQPVEEPATEPGAEESSSPVSTDV